MTACEGCGAVTAEVFSFPMVTALGRKFGRACTQLCADRIVADHPEQPARRMEHWPVKNPRTGKVE
jgi:hypothetical protein